MKDIVNQELAVGNIVVFNPPRYKGLVTGKIIGFSPKMVRVEYSAPWVTGYKDGVKTNTDQTSRWPNEVMKVDEQVAFIYTLSK